MRKCVVCGLTDARALLVTHLSGGDDVVVCGTHDLMHRRAPRPAKTALELRAMLRDRRDLLRRQPAGDELGERLIEAFGAQRNRRASGNRRR